MSNHVHTDIIRSDYDQPKETKDKELWEKFSIDFNREAPEFPDNKIYATIHIRPESARKLIKKFLLFVNDVQRSEFGGQYKSISASGFNVSKPNDQISVKIQAIPTNKDWKTIKKSKSCIFTFTGQIFGICPVVTFDWDETNSKSIVIAKWYHISDSCAQKYIICLNNKEIHYINQQSISYQLEYKIYHLQPNQEYTLQIIAKLNNGKETYRSEPIDFTVPTTEVEKNMEIINVSNEFAPAKLLGVIDTNKDNTKKEAPLEDNQFQKRAHELLQKLEDQIKKKKQIVMMQMLIVDEK